MMYWLRRDDYRWWGRWCRRRCSRWWFTYDALIDYWWLRRSRRRWCWCRWGRTLMPSIDFSRLIIFSFFHFSQPMIFRFSFRCTPPPGCRPMITPMMPMWLLMPMLHYAGKIFLRRCRFLDWCTFCGRLFWWPMCVVIFKHDDYHFRGRR